MIKCTTEKDDNGNLIVKIDRKRLSKSDRKELDKRDTEQALFYLLTAGEDDQSYSDFSVYRDAFEGLLTDSPIILEHATYEDSYMDMMDSCGDAIFSGQVAYLHPVGTCDFMSFTGSWWFPDYQVINPINELIKHGIITFAKF